MTSIKSITSHTLDQPPSCIAFCPTQPQFFVVGTYLLHQRDEAASAVPTERESDANDDGDTESVETQKRSGTLIVYRLGGDTFTRITAQPTPDFAILDIQWTLHPARLGNLLAVASSTGLLIFYELNAQGELSHVATERICDVSVLVLSLCWHPLRPDVIGLTLSNGEVCLCQSMGDKLWNGDGISLTTVYQHSLETWMIALGAAQDSHADVLSGGDDQILHRSAVSDELDCNMLWEDRRIHQAGVTAILPLSRDLILTGSYDDHIRLISASVSGRRQVLAENNLSGGVWRLKLLRAEGSRGNLAAFPDVNRSLLVLASCMHAGARVVRLSWGQDGTWSFEVLARFEEHKSMNYGSDVQPSEDVVKSIVSTSFYDKLLCLWRFDVGSVDDRG